VKTLLVGGLGILPMRREECGSRDDVHHTLKHFLCPGENWSHLPPATASFAETHLGRAEAKGWLHEIRGYDEDAPDCRWWMEGERRAFVLKAHEDGYYPRYSQLVVEAGPPGPRHWRRLKPRGRWRTCMRGTTFTVIVVAHSRTVLVVSAYNRKLYEPAPAGKPLDPMLRAAGLPCCQVAAAKSVQDGEGGGKPAGGVLS